METEEAVSSAEGGKETSTRQKQEEASQPPAHLHPAAPGAGVTQHPACLAPPDSSLLQEHLFSKQEVVLGEASEDMSTNMGAGHPARLWGDMGVRNCSFFRGGNIVEGFGAWTQQLACLDPNLGSTISWLCDLGQIT